MRSGVHLVSDIESVAAVKKTVKARHPEDRPLDEDLGAWWVMHVKPNCEKQLATYLLNRNISYYMPLYQRKTKVGYLGQDSNHRGLSIQRISLFCSR